MGYLRLLDGTVSWVHCWNVLFDGTIVDATVDQYGPLWLGDVVLVAHSDPLARNYLHAPRHWELEVGSLRANPMVGPLRCVSGSEVCLLGVDDSDRPWCSLARGVLRLLTGWTLDDRLVRIAAGALRGKATTADVASTDDLTRPLLTEHIQHPGRQHHQPWLAAVFTELT